MSVHFFSENVADPVKGKKKLIQNWIKQIIESYQKKVGNINIIFCSNEYLLKINKQFLNHSYYTDIITFSFNEKDIISGDLYISTDQVKLNASDYKVSFSEELLRVIIHGILHLLGYDDQSDQQRMHMHVLENEALEKIIPLLQGV